MGKTRTQLMPSLAALAIAANLAAMAQTPSPALLVLNKEGSLAIVQPTVVSLAREAAMRHGW